jgi:hypothetical protein
VTGKPVQKQHNWTFFLKFPMGILIPRVKRLPLTELSQLAFSDKMCLIPDFFCFILKWNLLA